MSYMRVIPRDLFNEGNLLKCYGQIYLNLENMGLEALLVHAQSTIGFELAMNEATGGLTLDNVALEVREDRFYFERPINSREPYPLYMLTGDDEIDVFNNDGSFSPAMLEFLANHRDDST